MRIEVYKRSHKMKWLLLALVFATLFFGYMVQVQAQENQPTVEEPAAEGATAEQTLGLTDVEGEIALSSQDIRVTVAKIIRAVLGLLGIIAVVIVLYAGFLWMTAGGNDEQIGKAKQWLINGIIGLAIILSAFAITQFVISKLAGATDLNGGKLPPGCTSLPCEPPKLPSGCLRLPCDGGAFVVKITPGTEVEPVNTVIKLFFQNNGAPAEYDEQSVKFGENITLTDVSRGANIPGISFRGEFHRPAAIFLYPTLTECPAPGPAQEVCLNANHTYRVEVKDIKMQGTDKTLKCGGGLPGAFACNLQFTPGVVENNQISQYDETRPDVAIMSPHEGDGLVIGEENSIQVHTTDDHGISAIRYFVNNKPVYDNVFDGSQKEIDDDFNWFVDPEEFNEGDAIEIKVIVWDVDNNNHFDTVTIAPRPAHCFDGIQNFGEVPVADKGDGCGKGPKEKCKKNSDCASGVCSTGGVCIDVPRIDWVSPESSAPSTYVTVGGRFFGDAQGTSRVCLLRDRLAETCNNQIPVTIPLQCGPEAWSDNQVVIEVPEGLRAEQRVAPALELNGVNEYARLWFDDSQGLDLKGSGITLEAFVTYEGPAPHGGNMYIVSRGDRADAPHYSLYVTPQGNVGFEMGLARGIIDATSPAKIPNDGAFHFVAVTYTGTEIRMRIDGVDVHEVPIQSGMSGGGFATGIGARSTGLNSYKGLIHSIAIWDKHLSRDVLTQHFQQGIPVAGPQGGQQAYWRFVESLRDRTDNHNDLTGFNIEPANYVDRAPGIAGEEGVVRFPVRLERTIEGTVYGDASNDTARGQWLPRVLTIDDVDRPSLCVINPERGSFETMVALTGKKFGADQGGRRIFFGERSSPPQGAWTDTELSTKAPNIAPGAVSVFVQDGAVKSNAMEFQVTAVGVDKLPFIESITPGFGSAGQYVTIRGRNLGTNPDGRSVAIFEVTDPDIQAFLTQNEVENEFFADVDFPEACGDGMWTNQSVIVKVPQALKDYAWKYMVQHPARNMPTIIYIRLSTDPLVATNAVSFNVDIGEPSPGICLIDPANGPLGTQVNLIGERLALGAGQEGRILFWKEGASSAQNAQTGLFTALGGWQTAAGAVWDADSAGGQIMTRVPGDGTPENSAATGPVLALKGGRQSNAVPFTVYNCLEQNNECPAELFGEGKECCPDGRKKGSCSAECTDPVLKSEFAWRYSTGKIPQAPTIVEQCGKGFVPSPSPWSGWPNAGQVCLNASITFTFTVEVEDPTDFIEVNRCTGADPREPCATSEALTNIVTDVRLVEGRTVVFMNLIQQNGAVQLWNQGTTYQVRLREGILSVGTPERPSAPFPASPEHSAECGEGTSYCFRFTTTEQAGSTCEVAEVLVNPADYTAYGFGMLTANTDPLKAVVNISRIPDWRTQFQPPYNVVALAPERQCTAIAGLQWEWTTSNNRQAALVPLDPPADQTFVDIKQETDVNKNGVTDPVELVRITAKIAGSNDARYRGTGTLTIDLPQPRIERVWPLCNTACVNSEIAYETNIPMHKAFTTAATRLYKCLDETCTNTVRVSTRIAFRKADATESDERITVIKPVDAARADTILEPNTLYVVKIIAALAMSRDGISFAAAAPDQWNQGFGNASTKAWAFRTKNDGSLCSISNVEVVPAEIMTYVVGERQAAELGVQGPQDSCGPFGVSILNASLYRWSWNVEGKGVNDRDPAGYSVNDIAKVSNLDLGGALPLYCSAQCLLTGAPVRAPFGACGDGALAASEECDIANSAACAARCLFTGNANSIICGNGTTQQTFGETCDDGNNISGDGCSAKCLREGSGTRRVVNLPMTVCGDTIVGADETCDDGNAVSGDGCSEVCLKEGTQPAAFWCAQVVGGISNATRYVDCRTPVVVCGNGRTESGEACDDGNALDDDGCSALCLNEGTRPVADGGLCGNNTVEHVADDVVGPREDCDDGDVIDGDGCSTQCLFEGSSLNYVVPSVCGDGASGTGEQCEGTAGGDGRVDPAQFAQAVGKGIPDVETKQQRTAISVNEASTPSAYRGTAAAQFILQCGFAPDVVCPVDPDHNGVGYNSCCSPRPVLSEPFPRGDNTCRNTSIRIKVDEDVDPATLTDNIFILTERDGQCPDGETSDQLVGQRLASASAPTGFFGRLWGGIKRTVVRISGGRVFAENYCKGSVPGDPFFTVQGEERFIGFKLARAFASSTVYYVKIKGGQNGLLSADGVPLKEDLYWRFKTMDSDTVCTLDVLELNPNTWTFTATRPGTGVFCSSDADCGGGDGSCFKEAGAEVGRCRLDSRFFDANGFTKQTPGQAQRDIVPVDGYRWSIGFTPADANASSIVGVASTLEGGAALAENRVRVWAKANGAEKLIGTATITEDTFNTPSTEDEKVTGKAAVNVFLCDNSWPALPGVAGAADPVFPYEDKPVNDDHIDVQFGQNPPQAPQKLFFGNFSVYYCRDSGASGLLDDMPALVPTVLYASRPEYEDGNEFGGGLLKQFHLLNPGRANGSGQNDLIGVRIHKNDKLLSLSEWYAKERPFDPAGITESMVVDGYPAARVGNTVYVNVADKLHDGTLSSRIFVISVGAAPGLALHADTQNIFDQFLNNIRFNNNIESFSYCAPAGAELPSAGADSCSSDFECPVGQQCLAKTDKLKRDWQRIFDVKDMSTAFSEYVRITSTQGKPGSFPNLQEISSTFGSFLPFMTNSTWNSWQGALGNTLATALPRDPLNRFAVAPADAQDRTPVNRCGQRCSVHQNLVCGANSDCPSGEQCLGDNGFDSTTCWNAARQQFLCPLGSQVYRYVTDARGSFAELGFAFEYTDATWPLLQTPAAVAAWRTANDWLDTVRWNIGNVCTVAQGQHGNVFGIEGTCGDGVVNVSAGEQCESGMVQSGVGACGPVSDEPFNTALVNNRGVDRQFNNLAGGNYALFVTTKGLTYVPPDSYNDGPCKSIPGVQHHVSVYVDKNQDGSFDQSAELVGAVCNDSFPDREITGFVNTGFLPAGNYTARFTWDNLDTTFRQGNWGIGFVSAGIRARKQQACNTACTWAVEDACAPAGRCGDGTIQAPEICDDGGSNGLYGGYCNTSCSGRTGFCGNGIKETVELCDPTNSVDQRGWCTDDNIIRCENNGKCAEQSAGTCQRSGIDIYAAAQNQSCRFDCVSYGPFCGDGIVQAPYETCDDKNSNDLGDACKNDCQLTAPSTPAECGNGKLETGEQCDLEAQNGRDCTVTCQFSGNTCGFDSAADDDHGVSANGQFDDSLPPDGKPESSTLASAFKDPGEVCDNGAQNGIVPVNCPWGTECTYCAADCSAVLGGSSQSPVYCGNGRVDEETPEVCDWGVGHLRTWDAYMASSTAVADGLDAGSDRSPDLWCIDVEGGYRDYPARCNQDCTGFQCVERNTSGQLFIQQTHKLCDENSECSRVYFTFDDTNLNCEDDLYTVKLENTTTGKVINLAAQRLAYAKAETPDRPADKVEQWGYWGPRWRTDATANLPTPASFGLSFEFDSSISQGVNIGHLPVGSYRLEINSIYTGSGPGTFNFTTEPPDGVTTYNIFANYQRARYCSGSTTRTCTQDADCRPPTCVVCAPTERCSALSAGADPIVLERFDFIPEESIGLNASARFNDTNVAVCNDPTIDLPTNPNQGLYEFPMFYNLQCGTFRLPAPAAQCADGTVPGKAVYRFNVLPASKCGNGRREWVDRNGNDQWNCGDGEECDGGANCTAACRLNPSPVACD